MILSGIAEVASYCLFLSNVMDIKGRIRRKINQWIYPIRKLLTNDNNIYLIYTMGKVGSSSIFESLKRKKPYSDVFHVHFLSENYLENILPRRHENFRHNITIGENVLAHIDKKPGSRIKIVTLTREPIERAISDLFQNWRHLYDDIEEVPKIKLKEHIESLQHDYTLD